MGLKTFIGNYKWWLLIGVIWGLISYVGLSEIGGIGASGTSSRISIYPQAINPLNIIVYLPSYLTLSLLILITGSQVSYSTYALLIIILPIPVAVAITSILGRISSRFIKVDLKSTKFLHNLKPRTKGALIGLICGLFIFIINIASPNSFYSIALILMLPWNIFSPALALTFLWPIWILYGYLIGRFYEKHLKKYNISNSNPKFAEEAR